MSEFQIGQEVICVDDELHPEWPVNAHAGGDMHGLTKGQVYTIRGLEVGRVSGWLEVHLVEIVRQSGTPFAASRFRPLNSKAIELFRTLAADATAKKKITVKETEKS